MKIKFRKLNLLDIVSNKKDLLWGKEYFGLFKASKLTNYLIFGKHNNISKVLEIFHTDTYSKELIEAFVTNFAKKTKYFISELDELRDLNEIELMRNCGFLRYNRNFCFDFNANERELADNEVHEVYCREIKRSDYKQLADFDRHCQIVDYRDYLFRDYNFFKNQSEDVFVFTQTKNLNNIVAYAIKRDYKDKSVFNFILSPTQAHLIHDCIRAFAEKYVFFEKFDDNFYFVINENLKNEIEQIRKTYTLMWSNQLLIKEGNPKIKSGLKTLYEKINILKAAKPANKVKH